MNSVPRKSTLLGWASKRPKTDTSPLELSDVRISETCRPQTVSCANGPLSISPASLPLNSERVDSQITSPEMVSSEVSTEVSLLSSQIAEQSLSMMASEDSAEEESKFSFLATLRDKFGNSIDSREYDKTSLFIPEPEFAKMTNCEEQFWRIKKDYFDAIVFFKKGKFYELFESDAVLSADVFGLKLTKRGAMKMTGVPEMSLEYWTSRFVERGYKVAIVDQKESAVAQNMRIKQGEAKKSVIERELKEVVTEVTNSQEGLGICSLSVQKTGDSDKIMVSLAIFRPMESEFFVQTLEDTSEMFQTQGILKKENIKEVIVDAPLPLRERQTRIRQDRWAECPEAAIKTMGGQNLASDEKEVLENLVAYLQYLKYQFTPQLVKPTERNQKSMYIDGRTIETLALVDDPHGNSKERVSVFSQIDRTRTRLGKRLLREWLLQPLYTIQEIDKRYNTTERLEALPNRAELEHFLQKIHDINDFVKKGKNQKIRPEEIRKFAESFASIKKIHCLLSEVCGPEDSIRETLLPDILKKIKDFAIGLGVLDGFDIAETISLLKTDKRLLEAQAHQQRVATAITAYARTESTAQGVGFVAKRLGRDYFLETAAKKSLPPHFALVGSTKNAARYTTPSLKRLSEEFLETEEHINSLGQDCILEISSRIAEHEDQLRVIAQGIAELDCLLSFAEIAGARAEYADTLDISGLTNIKKTHVPNAIVVDSSNPLLVLTGPNMAGKSTFLRNISVAVILRQMGMRVPATAFSGPIYDRIFTRIGAGDNLIDGESTFQVEMKETANILRQATANSFVIIDELGRGTSTKEGSAISFAVKEYLKTIKCTSLYATHFFNAIHPRDRVVKMDYTLAKGKEGSQEMLYLYKLVDGLCDDSCGINICTMAKVPKSVIERAIHIKKARAAVR
ncbi:DNA mismatch repair protein MSH6 [Nematocida homosporus]|uniref:DNA mismatch repair protein MSH6 n=1 Tax=Nematocida homosporus TaxID=1912981 RepID=UPI00221F3B63|nr:DNA mismatch repair protein MSH6 [Nematocida homosporus]KAI5187220.1 DNA mismatch repair protein MSH6 [Nematocida homosporus]